MRLDFTLSERETTLSNTGREEPNHEPATAAPRTSGADGEQSVDQPTTRPGGHVLIDTVIVLRAEMILAAT
jgi:hypothetical protein